MSLAQGLSSVDDSIKEIRTDGDGRIQTASTVSQAVPDAGTAAELLALYDNFSGVAAGDFVTRRATSNGQLIK